MKRSGSAIDALSLQFPLVIIDFEATALSLQSYPIEVGVACAADADGPISSWSSLIAPDRSWNVDAQWDPDAERVHGISRWQLRSGRSAQDVMVALNAAVGSARIVWCDGGHYDLYWLGTLTHASGIEPTFTLKDISVVFASEPVLRARYRDLLNRSVAPHRAGPDAYRICLALSSLLQAIR